MPKKPPFHRMPVGQQRVHVDSAVKLVLKNVAGDPRRITEGHIEAATRQTDVPAAEIRRGMNERGMKA